MSLDIMFVVHDVLNPTWQVSMHVGKTGSGWEARLLLLMQSNECLES